MFLIIVTPPFQSNDLQTVLWAIRYSEQGLSCCLGRASQVFKEVQSDPSLRGLSESAGITSGIEMTGIELLLHFADNRPPISRGDCMWTLVRGQAQC